MSEKIGAINKLTWEYAGFLKAHGLPSLSAEDMLADAPPRLTDFERTYLLEFIERWEQAMKEDQE